MNSKTTDEGRGYIDTVSTDPTGRNAAEEGALAAEGYLEPVPPYAQAIITASELITWWRERRMDESYPFRRRIIGGIAVSIALSAAMWSDLPDGALNYLDNLGVSSVYDKHTGLCQESGGLFREDGFVTPGTDGNCP
jgi:hypothetical protein